MDKVKKELMQLEQKINDTKALSVDIDLSVIERKGELIAEVIYISKHADKMADRLAAVRLLFDYIISRYDHTPTKDGMRTTVQVVIKDDAAVDVLAKLYNNDNP